MHAKLVFKRFLVSVLTAATLMQSVVFADPAGDNGDVSDSKETVETSDTSDDSTSVVTTGTSSADKAGTCTMEDYRYILDYYNNPSKLFRTEVHLNNEEVKSYLDNNGIEFTPLVLLDEALLERMFFHYLDSIIRFKSKDKQVNWQHILGRP